MSDKEALRRAMRARRQALAQGEQEAAAQAALDLLRGYAPYRQAKTVLAYMACRGEMGLAPALLDILESGKTLLLPRCEAAGGMTARRVRDPAQLTPGAYGIPEPGEDCEILPPQAIDLILVPGAAFGRDGGRIGQGGGYYDRYLRGTRAWRVGVCHGFALLDSVPAEAHDMRMDAILTPQGVIHVQHDRRA